MQKKYFIQTYGCQMNEHDSEIIAGLLNDIDFSSTDNIEEADFILINTCCIREKAESKVLSLLGELKKYVEKKPDLIIGVCGCMIQQKNIIPKILHACPHVSILFGTNNMNKVAEYVKKVLETNEPVFVIQDDSTLVDEQMPSKRQFKFKAFVNITYGCNNFCTYCIVPYVRGRERSRSKEEIITEIRNLVKDGVIEVTLLGQNVNSYGNDLDSPVTFASLLKAVDEIEGLKRIRFMTSHPKDFSQELIDVIKNGKHICHSVHLPVQSGSNSVLKRMNRKYTREHYIDIVNRLRQAIPDVSLTTDIIVGFPNETDEEFKETLSLVEQIGFDNAFSFVYSKREGTIAATFEDSIPLEIKKLRLQELNALLSKWSLEKNEQYQDKVVDVLVESISKTDNQMLNGRTESSKTVIFQGDSSLLGKIVKVKITKIQTWILKGELVV